jgi:hypothetical protein
MCIELHTDCWVSMKTAFCVIKLSTCEVTRKTTNLQRVKPIKNLQSTNRFRYLYHIVRTGKFLELREYKITVNTSMCWFLGTFAKL